MESKASLAQEKRVRRSLDALINREIRRVRMARAARLQMTAVRSIVLTWLEERKEPDYYGGGVREVWERDVPEEERIAARRQGEQASAVLTWPSVVRHKKRGTPTKVLSVRIPVALREAIDETLKANQAQGRGAMTMTDAFIGALTAWVAAEDALARPGGPR